MVRSLGECFDRYWDSDEVYDLHAITSAASRSRIDDARAIFDRDTTQIVAPLPPAQDEFGAAPLSAQLVARTFRFLSLDGVSVYADAPEKAQAGRVVRAATVARFIDRLDEAQHEVVLFSPYFVPNGHMTQRLRSLRARGVSVRIVTNSMSVSDEPFVNIGMERHQRELLAMGVELYELSS